MTDIKAVSSSSGLNGLEDLPRALRNFVALPNSSAKGDELGTAVWVGNREREDVIVAHEAASERFRRGHRPTHYVRPPAAPGGKDAGSALMPVAGARRGR